MVDVVGNKKMFPIISPNPTTFAIYITRIRKQIPKIPKKAEKRPPEKDEVKFWRKSPFFKFQKNNDGATIGTNSRDMERARVIVGEAVRSTRVHTIWTLHLLIQRSALHNIT